MWTLSAVLSSCHVYTILVFGAGGVAICRRIRWDIKVANDSLVERVKLELQLNESNNINAAVLNTYIVEAIFNLCRCNFILDVVLYDVWSDAAIFARGA